MYSCLRLRLIHAETTVFFSLTPVSIAAIRQPALPQSLANKDKFQALFNEPSLDRHLIGPKIEVSLFVLKSDSGGFDYTNMYKQLGNASMTYVLSRNRFASIPADAQHEAVKSVQRSFRRASQNDGEGGELLLYCFLESHLGAPKILSKMELKTAQHDYVKGSDGLHLLELNPGNYHLVFGESKMIGDSTNFKSSFRSGIYQALKSIKEVQKNGLLDEIELIDSNLMKESFSAEKISYLKEILIPTRAAGGPRKQTAFGIFVGFEIDTTAWLIVDMTAEAIEAQIHLEVLEMVEERLEYIKSRIVELGLSGYQFYIYAVPFIKDASTNIDIVRKRIVEEI